MSTKSHVPGKITAALSVVFLIPPLILFMMYSSVGLRYPDMSDSSKMDTYLGYFPKGLQDITIINAISIAFCIIAIILASRSFKKHLLSIRLLMLITVLLAIFLILIDLFQLL
jgi:hypothetical protein